MMSYSKSILSVSVVAFFVATLFVFSVPAQGEDAGIIYGAYQKNNGMLRIIADPSEARPSENVISWSQSCDCDLSDPEILDDLIQALQDQVDPWHEVGAEGEPAFETYTRPEDLTYSWYNVPFSQLEWWLSAHMLMSSYSPTTAAVFQDLSGVVHLKGVVDFETSLDSISPPRDPRVIFVLPEGYRPAHDEMHVVTSTDPSAVRVIVLANGEVRIGIWPTGPVNPIFLEGIAFRAAEVTE